jgi:hypothetical protein
MKKAIHLRKHLDPSASIHRTRDLEILKTYVSDVQALVEKLPAAHAQELREDLSLGIKAIITEPKPRKKVKPDLCVDDIFEF